MRKWRSWPCHDCGVAEGQLHQPGCDMERCPFCGGQLLGCRCAYKKLKIDHSKGTWAYKHGLTEDQEARWDAMLEAQDRIPYILNPNLCALCGEQWPECFRVSDKEWEHYVIPSLQNEILCLECYTELKRIFPYGWKHTNWG